MALSDDGECWYSSIGKELMVSSLKVAGSLLAGDVASNRRRKSRSRENKNHKLVVPNDSEQASRRVQHERVDVEGEVGRLQSLLVSYFRRDRSSPCILPRSLR